jgi:hypothetical protein
MKYVKYKKRKEQEEILLADKYLNELSILLDELSDIVQIGKAELNKQIYSGNLSAGIRGRKSLRIAKQLISKIVRASIDTKRTVKDRARSQKSIENLQRGKKTKKATLGNKK